MRADARARRSRGGTAYSRGEELAHAISHGLGLALALGGLVPLARAAAGHPDARHDVAAATFGAALVLLYACSTLYHALPGRAKAVFRRLDHAAIYLLIAGTWTPFALVGLHGARGLALLGGVWAVATAGVVLEAAWPRLARRLSLPLCLGLGWLAVLALPALEGALGPGGLALLGGGGVAYTAGVPFYAWPRLRFGHAVWHAFVLGGSVLHFLCVVGHVLA